MSTENKAVLFTMEGREHMRRLLRPSNPDSLFMAERGFLDNECGAAFTDSQALELLTDKLKSELARAQSLNDLTEVLLDQLIRSHAQSIQGGGPGANLNLFFARFEAIWSGLKTTRIEAGRKLPGEK